MIVSILWLWKCVRVFELTFKILPAVLTNTDATECTTTIIQISMRNGCAESETKVCNAHSPSNSEKRSAREKKRNQLSSTVKQQQIYIVWLKTFILTREWRQRHSHANKRKIWTNRHAIVGRLAGCVSDFSVTKINSVCIVRHGCAICLRIFQMK